MDSLTVHYIALELQARWCGRPVTHCLLDRQRLGVVIGAKGSQPVRFDLVPSAPVACIDAHAEVGGTLRSWAVTSVEAPVDDRQLVIRFDKPGRFRGSPVRQAVLQISFVPTARGALLRTVDGHRLAAIGAPLPAPAAARPVLEPPAIASAAAAGDVAALMRSRWMSGWLAGWLTAAPLAAAARYADVCALGPPRPSRCGAQLLPVPACTHPEPVDSLIEPQRAERSVPGRHDRAAADARAVARMRRELTRAEAEAPRLRAVAHALLALGATADVPTAITLADGTVHPLEPRPGETPVTLAERLHRDARSMERALALLPARIAARERGDPAPHRAARSPRRHDDDRASSLGGPRSDPRPAESRAFRTYYSTGGLEIRVGRGAAANDVLTFHASSPDDVWLHARNRGAHVILRWRSDEAPPLRDLEEAAALAAWHSRSRGSAVVPVDWTRRRYVRKPRGAVPGLVTITHARTLFVRPSAELERRLRSSP